MKLPCAQRITIKQIEIILIGKVREEKRKKTEEGVKGKIGIEIGDKINKVTKNNWWLEKEMEK